MRLTEALDKSSIAYADIKGARYFCGNMECFKEIKDGNKKKIVKVKDLNEIMCLNWRPMGK